MAEPTKTPAPLLASGRAIAARQAVAMKDAQGGQAPAASTDLRSGSFLKTAAGIATLVIFGAGVAYAVYSSSNDRIKSPGR